MNIGMLWFDNDPKAEIGTKINRAATYYRDKYGKAPNLCFIHPSMLGNSSAETAAGKPAEKPAVGIKNGTIEVRTSRSVLPNHFWIGVNGSINPTES